MDKVLEKIIDSLPDAAQERVYAMGAREGRYQQQRYFSRARIAAAVAVAAGVSTFSIKRGASVQLFGYGHGELMNSAGFPTEYGGATIGDTNLQTKGITNDGEFNVIHGISVQLDPRNDAEAVRQIFPELTLQAGFGSEGTKFKFGPLVDYPGASGLTQSGRSNLVTPGVNDASAIVMPGVNNGFEGFANLRRLDDMLMWYPSPETDSNLQMQVTVSHDHSWTATARAAAAGIVGFTPPTAVNAPGTYIDIRVVLHGYQFGTRSRN